MKKLLTLCTGALVAASLVPNAAISAQDVEYKEMTANEFLAMESAGMITLSENVLLTETTNLHESIEIDGNGYVISVKEGTKNMFRVINEDDEANDVTFRNVTLTNSTANGRCVDVRNDNVNLIIEDATLNTLGSGNNQPVTVGGYEHENINVTLNRANINAGKAGYAYISFVKNNLTLMNSKLEGYAALYYKDGSENSGAMVYNSTLHGSNPVNPSVPSNDFGTIVFEDGYISMNIQKSTVIAEGYEEGNSHSLFLTSVDDEGWSATENYITVDNSTVLKVIGKATITSDATGNEAMNDGNNLLIKDATSNVEIPSEYLPEDKEMEKNEEGNYEVVDKKDDTTTTPGEDGGNVTPGEGGDDDNDKGDAPTGGDGSSDEDDKDDMGLDYTKLLEVAARLDGVDLTKYTEDSVAKLQKAIEVYNDLMEKEDVTQQELDAVVEEIDEAIDGLELLKDSDTPSDEPSDDTTDSAGESTQKPGGVDTGDPTNVGGLSAMLLGSLGVLLKKRK